VTSPLPPAVAVVGPHILAAVITPLHHWHSCHHCCHRHHLGPGPSVAEVLASSLRLGLLGINVTPYHRRAWAKALPPAYPCGGYYPRLWGVGSGSGYLLRVRTQPWRAAPSHSEGVPWPLIPEGHLLGYVRAGWGPW
jgi:hypothetical protein